MKPYSATGRRGVVAVRRPACVTVMFAVAALSAIVMAGASLAQDVGEATSSLGKLDSVLVLPPVYRSDAAANAESAPADTCAEDCSSSGDPDVGQPPTAVAGTADNPANASAGTADNPADNPTDDGAPTDESAAAVGSTSEESGEQRQATANGGDLASPDNLDSSLGSAQVGSPQDYEAQQAAAQELGASGIMRAPSVIIGAPIGPFYVPGTFGAAVPRFGSAGSLPTSSWMPQPMTRVQPLPSIVPYGLPRTMAAFPGAAFPGTTFPGGFGGFRGFGRR
jgi:hypothetical protein